MTNLRIEEEYVQLIELCTPLAFDKIRFEWLNHALTITVSVMNIFIRKIMVQLVEKIGLNTQSKHLLMVTMCVFWAMFVNA